jgi:exodeoxyribonuclease VII large subunit
VRSPDTGPPPEGIPGVELTGPWPVGRYAVKLREWLRGRARVQLFGEVWGWRVHRTRVYFELRDADGAVPCSMWLNDLERLGLPADALSDGARVVVAGGPDYYPGSRTSSPGFSFAVRTLRPAGEGDLLTQLDLLRKRLDAEGLFAPQKALARPALPRSIGVVTGEGGKARDDVLAGLSRRGWAGRVVWAFAPVQDRHAAPAITRALQDLAACGEVDVIVVARGGGSLADLFCFCDETLCRTVAMLPVPVVASVGHHTDRTLLDDVAAASCSTPTHAAETAVPCHCGDARTRLARDARRLEAHGRRAAAERARVLARLARAPVQHVARERARLHQQLREVRASGARRLRDETALLERERLVLSRKATAADVIAGRRDRLDALALALAAHDPERTLARGYALVEDERGEILTTAEAARAAGAVRIRFADDTVKARTE